MKNRAAAELEKTQAVLERERQEREQVAAELEQSLSRRDELAEDPAAFASNEQRIHDLQAERRRREIVVERRKADVQEAQRRLSHAQWHDVEQELKSAYGERAKDSKAVAALLKGLEAGTGKLQTSRRRVEELEAKFQALVPEDVNEWELPQGRDEPEWPDAKDALEIAAAGPQRPEADLAAGRVRAAEKRERSRESTIRLAVRQMLAAGRSAGLLHLHEDLHPEALRRYQGELEAELAKAKEAPQRAEAPRRAALEARIAETREQREQIEQGQREQQPSPS